MTRYLWPGRTRSAKMAVIAVAAAGGIAVAALVGVAVAKSFTLQVAKNAKVTNQSGTTTTENIAVNSHGFAVYTLSGDSKSHPKCTKANGCFKFWPPVTVSSAKKLSKAPGIKGKLGVWRRNGLIQLTLAGHPLYRFSFDSKRHTATGEGLHSFKGFWHVVKAAGSPGGTPTTPTMTTTTTPPPCLYPPCG
jgi:predicted lipoprotein with Yx(FWY)xxD motif